MTDLAISYVHFLSLVVATLGTLLVLIIVAIFTFMLYKVATSHD